MPPDSGSPSARKIDHYRLDRRLALGGMAEIFLATDERNGRQVALKRILPQIATDHGFLDRFFHEIRIQIALKHRNVVELLDCSPSVENPYIVMEFVDGGSLAALRHDAGGRFPWEIAVHIASETLLGLSAAHRKGIVHRDVKPQNVMWTTEGVVKIADFGISQADHLTRLTVTGTVVGTPSYMSPEQARGETLDPRSDLFSVGTVLYELLTGRNPFAADAVTDTLRRVVEVAPEAPSLLDPSIPPSVDHLVGRLHAKSRDARVASAEEANHACRALLADEGILNAGPLFRSFLGDPRAFLAERKKRDAAESLATAEKLAKDPAAPAEEVLWAAFRTLSVEPENATAKTLFQTMATRVGQREKPVDNLKIKDLEKQLRQDPENVALLLQLAKLYRLEKDFVSVMKFYRKLRTLSPGDAYTQGQVAALLGDKGAAAAVDATGRRRAPVKTAPPLEEPARSTATTWGFAIFVLLLVVGGIILARRPRLTPPEDLDAKKVAAVLKTLKDGPATPVPAAAAKIVSDDDRLQKALEKGALLEKEGGAAKALAFYRETLGSIGRAEAKAVLLMTIAECAAKSGDAAGAHAALDQAIALGGGTRLLAMYRKGELLESAHDDASAQRLFEQVTDGDDPELKTKATLKLAMASDRAGDAAHALALYEALLAKAPSSPEANSARLGAGALYRAEGRKADARRMFEEVKQNTTPGSDFEKSADQGLKSLE